MPRNAPLGLFLANQILIKRILLLSDGVDPIEVVEILDLERSIHWAEVSLWRRQSLMLIVIAAGNVGHALTVHVMPARRRLESLLADRAEIIQVFNLFMVTIILLLARKCHTTVLVHLIEVGAGRVRPSACLLLLILILLAVLRVELRVRLRLIRRSNIIVVQELSVILLTKIGERLLVLLPLSVIFSRSCLCRGGTGIFVGAINKWLIASFKMVFGVMTDIVGRRTVDHSQVRLVIEHARCIYRILTLDRNLGVIHNCLGVLLGILVVLGVPCTILLLVLPDHHNVSLQPRQVLLVLLRRSLLLLLEGRFPHQATIGRRTDMIQI